MSEKQKSDCPGSYEVSGYTTDKGKKVDSYTRSCWKHSGGASGGGVTNGLNEGENPYPNKIFEKSNSNPKKTETDIKNLMKIIETLLKQKEVSNNDISLIRNSLKSSVGSICNDIESISYRRLQQPEIPTVESMENGKVIEQDRKQTIDNATNVITSINLAQNALKKNFDSVRMDSPEYNKKLYEYIRQSDELKKMSNSVMDLFQEAKSPKKNSINTVNRIRQEIGLLQNNILNSNYNGITGSAANINNKLAFENISIPYENTMDEENSTILQGHIEKTDDNIKEINHKVTDIEKQENIMDENIEDVLEQEEIIINSICEECEQLQQVKIYNKIKLQKSVENNINSTIKVNNRIEKIIINNENISDKLKRKIRQITVNLYNLYVSVVNKQKEKMIREIYKLKVAFDSTRIDKNNEKMETQNPKDNNQKWIMPCIGSIVGEYGEPRATHTHNGIDIAVPVGTPVKAIADGTVVAARLADGYGKFVVIEHSLNGQIITSEYGHISRWIVSKNQIVKQGQIIAYSGNEGYSFGPHVHLTIRIGKYQGKAVNPWDYINR